MTRKLKKRTAIIASAVLSLSMLSYLPNDVTFFKNESAITSYAYDKTVEGDYYFIKCDDDSLSSETDAVDNEMTLNEDGLYQKVYKTGKHDNIKFGIVKYNVSNTSPHLIDTVSKIGSSLTYETDIVQSTDDEVQYINGRYIYDSEKFVFSSTKDESEVIITYNPTTNRVSITGDVENPVFSANSVSVYGNGNSNSNWLNGIDQNPSSSENKLTEVEDNIYEITYYNVPEGNDYFFKFADGSWFNRWGVGTESYLKNGVETELTYKGENILVDAPDSATIKIRLDLTQCNANNGEGAKGTVTVTLPYKEYDINGDGKDEIVYQIDSKKDLAWFADYVNNGHSDANAALTDDITFDDSEWTSIKNYSGTFDGNGHKINNIYITSNHYGALGSEEDACGFFANTLSGATIKNLGINGKVESSCVTGGIVGENFGTIENCYMQGSVNINYSFVGGIVGENFGTLKNCHNDSEITAQSFVGGLIAVNHNNTTITDCYNTGAINSTFTSEGCAGGLIGLSNDTTMTGCYNTGAVTAKSKHTGGLIGEIENSNGTTISNCYNTGAVTADVNVGGLIGKIDEYSYNTKISNCYNVGTITGNDDVGSLIGVSHRYATTFSNCYYRKYCNGDNTFFNYVDGKARSLKDFQSGKVAYLLSCGDADAGWSQTLSGENKDYYPVFDGDKVYKDENHCPIYTNNENEQGEHFVITEGGLRFCPNCGEALEIGAHLEGYTLSLDGNIGVNFYMALSDDVINDPDAYMQFTLPDGTIKTLHTYEAYPDTSMDQHTTYYVFSCGVLSSQMTGKIRAQLFDGEGNSSKEYTYSVAEYAEYLLSHKEDYNESDINLVKALLNLGATSQIYFNGNKNNLANSILSDDDKNVPILDASALEQYKSVNTKSQLGEFVGFDLMLKSKTTLNLYFKPAENIDIDSIDFTVNDTYFMPIPYGDYYCIPFEGLKAWELDKTFTFSATSKQDKSISSTIQCSAMSYCYNVLRDYGKTYSDKLKTSVSALRAFNEAAKVRQQG